MSDPRYLVQTLSDEGVVTGGFSKSIRNVESLHYPETSDLLWSLDDPQGDLKRFPFIPDHVNLREERGENLNPGDTSLLDSR